MFPLGVHAFLVGTEGMLMEMGLKTRHAVDGGENECSMPYDSSLIFTLLDKVTQNNGRRGDNLELTETPSECAICCEIVSVSHTVTHRCGPEACAVICYVCTIKCKQGEKILCPLCRSPSFVTEYSLASKGVATAMQADSIVKAHEEDKRKELQFLLSELQRCLVEEKNALPINVVDKYCAIKGECEKARTFIHTVFESAGRYNGAVLAAVRREHELVGMPRSKWSERTVELMKPKMSEFRWPTTGLSVISCSLPLSRVTEYKMKRDLDKYHALQHISRVINMLPQMELDELRRLHQSESSPWPQSTPRRSTV